MNEIIIIADIMVRSCGNVISFLLAFFVAWFLFEKAFKI